MPNKFQANKIMLRTAIIGDFLVKSGTPQPNIHWLRNGTNLESFTSKQHTDYRLLDQGQGLEITRASAADRALWSCMAENEAGSAQLDIQLDVWGKFFRALE